MLQTIKFLSVLLLLTVVLSSCTKKETQVEKNSPMKCQINGKEFIADDSLSIAESIIINTEKGLSLRFTSGSYEKKFQEFTIPCKDSKPGEYDIDLNSTYKTNYPSEDTYFTKSGKFSISKIDDKHVEGTFNLVAKTWDDKKTVTVTDGKFNIRFK
jgi:hypothetical protein